MPTVCRPRSFGNPSNCCVVARGGAGTASRNCVVATGDARLGDCDAEGDERECERLDDDDVLDVDERDDLSFLLR
jgi:hypothetical protein